ncbi:ribosome maturation factor RimM [Phytohabitans houttuyneae]|uniref:Ribosome maturation factor RimM n=1 Tax=Phytohabitans houttuyneae TaxID=1076126 RepID=A0A6V8KBF1_9ACTN|nr:ribosome maturation factor RimM [Phytohabitans houttuyneae]
MLLYVGRIARPHGIRGEVIVDLRTDDPDERFAPGKVLVTDPGAMPSKDTDPAAFQVPERLTIEEVRSHHGRLIIGFDGIYDRNVAEALRGVLLCVDSADVGPLADPDEFHDHQLVGLTAVTPSGETLGEVARIDHAPASDLLVLRRPEGHTALVPFVKAIVPEVDLAGGRVIVDPPEGLFDL